MKTLIKELKQEVWFKEHSPKELRNFGWIVGGIFFLIAGYFYYREPSGWEVVLGVFGFLLVLGGFVPIFLKWPHKLWLTLSLVLGSIMNVVILTALFYLVITPIALVKKAADFFKNSQETSTFWQKHEEVDWKKSMEELS